MENMQFNRYIMAPHVSPSFHCPFTGQDLLDPEQEQWPESVMAILNHETREEADLDEVGLQEFLDGLDADAQDEEEDGYIDAVQAFLAKRGEELSGGQDWLLLELTYGSASVWTTVTYLLIRP
jgi:hypothetical protein